MFLLTILLVTLTRANTVSVDPDMELPVRSETEEDIYVFNSMNINPLDVRVNYRGQPHFPPQQVQQVHLHPAETERGGGSERQLVHRLGVASPPTTLSPGAGSWQFNSIESRARHGLTPTHVPKHGDLVSEASETVYSEPVTTPASEHGQKVTIPAQYKDILNKSEDYKRWLNLKNNFLRRHKKLKLPKKRQNLPKSSGTVQEDYQEKFPNFPGSYGGGEPEPRAERESLQTPGVFKEGGTLYRGRNVKSRQRGPVKTPVKTPEKTAVKTGEKTPAVQVSSLSAPRPTVRPGTTYSSPLYPNTPFYSTPQPPLPPGYELVPVDQLTEEHEVVPWEDLPHLMRKHNMSLSHIPLGPFHHSTTANPFTVFSSAPKYSSTSRPTPVPVYTVPIKTFTTSKPFTAFSSLPTRLNHHPRPPFIPPPVSPELSGETKQLPHPPVTASTTKSKPKSIHFGTHFGPLPGQVSSTTRGLEVVSNSFRYNPTTGPTTGLLDHTASLGRFSPQPSTLSTTPSLPSPGYSQISSSAGYPLYTPSTIKYHPTPTTIKYHTPSTIKYHPTPTTIKYHPTPSTLNYHPTPTTIKYHPTPKHTTPRYHPNPSTTVRQSQYQSTTALTKALLKYSSLTPSTIVNSQFLVPKLSSPPRPDLPPPPMPKFLAPPNKQLPTYFDVARPVDPSPPPSQPPPPSPPQNAPLLAQPRVVPSGAAVPIFQLGDNSVTEFPSTTTARAPIVLQGRLKTVEGDSSAPHVVFPSNVNLPGGSEVNSLQSAVATSQQAAIKQSQLNSKQFEHFTQKSSGLAEAQERPSSRLVALTTMRPELATKHNPNKMRSSTHRNNEDKTARFRPRPASPNFHPIRPRPTPMSRLNLVPQIRPKVPGSETESGVEVHDAITDTAVISNNNNGVWMIQEKMKEAGGQVKREFSSSENKTTVNPALTEKPRTWPSTLKKSGPDVSVIERGKSGQLDQSGSSRESTTFTTSRVEMSVSTTPGPSLMKMVNQKKMNNLASQSDSALKELMINKAHRLLESLSDKERQFERMDEMGNIRPKGKRRKKFKVQPKSLSGSEDGVHTVFPMDSIHTENKNVDQIFKSHPGLKRISAYDFERAMAGDQSALSITKPVAELKVSIEELANTMNQLNMKVLETSTKAEHKDVEDDKISQLQEEIAKLTKTLETLRLSPKAEKEMRSTMRSIISSTGRPFDISSNRMDFEESESVNTWHQSQDKNVIDANRRKVGSRPNKLDITEVFTRTTPAVTTTPVSTTRTTQTTTRRSTNRPVQVTPMKTETSDDDIIKFFGSPTEKLSVSNGNDHEFFKPKLIEKMKKTDFGSAEGSQDFNDIISKDASGVLGLFEMMGKINKEATNNFDVVKIANAGKTGNSNKPAANQPLISFEEMKEKFRIEEINKIKAQEEELRMQQLQKLKLFNMFQEEEKLQQQRREEQSKNKFSSVNTFDSLQGWKDDDSWEKTIKSNDDKGDDKGVAYASITIENVDVDDARDYDVNSNGIVRLRKEENKMPEKLEYEYEYYEADPDDIKFPVGGTRQFYETQTIKNLDNLNQISNKELLMNLLEASDNFQNREFLERLKNIVTGGRGGETGGGSRLATDVAENVLTGSSVLQNTRAPDLRSQDRWAPAKQLPTSAKTTKLHNNVNDLPIWPSTTNFGQSSPSLEKFEPINNQLVFPNRRLDEGVGVGEVSLVSDQERGRLTSISGFHSSQSQPDYQLSDRLDFTSDNEFVVGTSLSMNQGSFQPQNSRLSQTGVGGLSPGHFNSAVGFATPVPALTSVRAGTASPVLASGSSLRGSEVFRLGSGVQIQQPGGGGVRENQNYILPTFSHDEQAAGHQAASGEIYADIRLESGKKNLLTPHSEHQDLYIEPGHQPGAEVIVYPMGQLLSNSNRQFLARPDPMLMSGSDEDNVVMAQQANSGLRDQIPAFSYSDRSVSQILGEETDQRKSAPNGLLETIIRTAKDDLDFAGNVLNFLTSSRSH